jgi:hypothetical protein
MIFLELPMKAFSLEGHAALVSGSSQGIGSAIAQGLEDCGAAVVRHGLQDMPGSAGIIRLMRPICESAPATLIDSAFTIQPNLDTPHLQCRQLL